MVDELAHTNVPGSEREKRWQDVEMLLLSGLDVYSTLNIQHLESLNDLVAGYLMNKPKGLYLSPFRAMTADIRDDILRYQGPYVYVDGLILSVTRNIGTVDVDHHERYAGDSGYSLRKSISLWLKMATNFSIVPLRITSFVGLCFAGLGFVLALLLIIQKLTLDRMPIGWSSLIVTVLIVGGVQLLALGMLGEYLGRVLLILNSRPQYVVGETTD